MGRGEGGGETRIVLGTTFRNKDQMSLEIQKLDTPYSVPRCR